MSAYRSVSYRRRGPASGTANGRGREIKIRESHLKVLEFLLSAGVFLTANQVYHGMIPGNARITHGIVNAALARLVALGLAEKIRTSSAIHIYGPHRQ